MTRDRKGEPLDTATNEADEMHSFLNGLIPEQRDIRNKKMAMDDNPATTGNFQANHLKKKMSANEINISEKTIINKQRKICSH